jgi:hypothetical protein
LPIFPPSAAQSQSLARRYIPDVLYLVDSISPVEGVLLHFPQRRRPGNIPPHTRPITPRRCLFHRPRWMTDRPQPPNMSNEFLAPPSRQTQGSDNAVIACLPFAHPAAHGQESSSRGRPRNLLALLSILALTAYSIHAGCSWNPSQGLHLLDHVICRRTRHMGMIFQEITLPRDSRNAQSLVVPHSRAPSFPPTQPAASPTTRLLSPEEVLSYLVRSQEEHTEKGRRTMS